MSAEDAKKLIAEGLAKLQQGLALLCDTVEAIEPEEEEPSSGPKFAPIEDVAKAIKESMPPRK